MTKILCFICTYDKFSVAANIVCIQQEFHSSQSNECLSIGVVHSHVQYQNNPTSQQGAKRINRLLVSQGFINLFPAKFLKLFFSSDFEVAPTLHYVALCLKLISLKLITKNYHRFQSP